MHYLNYAMFSIKTHNVGKRAEQFIRYTQNMKLKRPYANFVIGPKRQSKGLVAACAGTASGHFKLAWSSHVPSLLFDDPTTRNFFSKYQVNNVRRVHQNLGHWVIIMPPASDAR
eukprot:2263614-Pleurochrysis_carterae.AAC.6